MIKNHFTVILTENNGYTALCPELDIATQGTSALEAKQNLTEAITLFFETASEEEISQKTAHDTTIEQLEIAIG